MLFQSKYEKTVRFQFFTIEQTTALSSYLNELNKVTKQGFAPHKFDEQSILALYEHPSAHIGFIAIEVSTGFIIAYSVIHFGHLQHDTDRLKNYGLELNSNTDAAFAPSVADAWQSNGIGSAMFLFIKSSLQQFGIKRLFLRGGVQTGNEKAIEFYLKHEFIKLGEFHYNGSNWDMSCELR